MTEDPIEHRLLGCSPIPLGNYLKALGVFRLVAEQVDSNATGCWRDERFLLRSRLTEQDITIFFTETYVPTPILSPWNNGSGFYYREGKDDKRGPDGKKKKTGVRDEATTSTRTLDAIIASKALRLEPLRTQAAAARAHLATFGQTSAPSDEGKLQLIADARGTMSDDAAAWIDTAATLTRDGLAFPPLLGSGGNDGNLDFSTTVFGALVELIDFETGAAKPGACELFGAAVLGHARPFATSGAISQFASANSGGLNAGSGFNGASTGNLWDIVLGIEGSLLMSSSAARRLGAGSASGGAFPFTMPRGGALSAGAGSVGIADEATARGEFWAPMWSRPTGLDELAALFREGRAVIKRRGARNSVDFARAVAHFGVSRGLDRFDRHAFEQRNGSMYVEVSLPRPDVPDRPMPDLIADLDHGRWLDSVRAALREKKSAATLQAVGRRLDDALYRLAGDVSSEAVQEALIAVGMVALECARRPRLRSADEDRRTLNPPPRLSAQWRSRADDQSAEFRLAAALAGLMSESLPSETGDVSRMPFRAHLAPLAVGRKSDQWGKGTAAEALVVWSGRDLRRDVAAMLERRLIESKRIRFVRRIPGANIKIELPLNGWPRAPLWAVTAFLAGDVDADRIAALAAGLAWVRPEPFSDTAARPERADSKTLREHGVPYEYAAIKALMRPGGVLTSSAVHALLQRDGDAPPMPQLSGRLIDPSAMVRLVIAGRGADAIRVARALAAGAQLRTPFPSSGSQIATAGLAAALAFPISDRATAILTDRAFPDFSRSKDRTDAS